MVNTNISLLEDDIELSEEICELLESRGFQVRCFRTISQFSNYNNLQDFDLFIIDLTLPDGDGIDAIKKIRHSSKCGIIVLSGRIDQTTKVLSLELGADDYIEKPMQPFEFIARVRRLLLRTETPSKTNEDNTPKTIYNYENWTTDLSARMMTNSCGYAANLTKLEFDLWVVFLLNEGVALSRDRLIYLIRGYDWAGSDRSIDDLVSRLRRKTTVDGQNMGIKTVHGVGYCLEKSEVQASKDSAM